MNAQQQASQLLTFIDASPSPWHVVEQIKQWLLLFHFQPLSEQELWTLTPGGRYFVIRDDSSIIAFVVGQQPLVSSGYKIVGAHTDSPGLRIKPNAAHVMDGWLRLGGRSLRWADFGNLQ